MTEKKIVNNLKMARHFVKHGFIELADEVLKVTLHALQKERKDIIIGDRNGEITPIEAAHRHGITLEDASFAATPDGRLVVIGTDAWHDQVWEDVTNEGYTWTDEEEEQKEGAG